jgi:hypothetical protein
MKIGRSVFGTHSQERDKKGPSFLFTGAIGATAPKPLFYLKKNAPRFFSLAGRRPAKVGRATATACRCGTDPRRPQAIRLRTARRSGQDRLVFGLEQEASAFERELIRALSASAGPPGCPSAPIRTCYGMPAGTNSPMTATYPSTATLPRSQEHTNIQHTVRYTELAADRFKDFWR